MPHLSLSPDIVDEWNTHKSRWKECQRCDLKDRRIEVCLVRGFLPAKYFFLGEAPGESEDSIGYPFVGPAGQLLDRLIEDAVAEVPKCQPFRFAISNVVGCFPRVIDSAGSGGIGKPNKLQIVTCRPRLLELFEIAKPQVLFTVGNIAKGHLPDEINSFLAHPPYHVVHPSYILRLRPEEQQLAYKKNVGAIARGLRDNSHA